MAEMQWVKPQLVAQIRFVEWTAEGRLRHAAFLGLRTAARDVGVRKGSQLSRGATWVSQVGGQ
jgi:bifunctional non-homologous end joining protein LigD